MIGHVKTLYANWSSVALYSTDEELVRTREVAAAFDDRVVEAESAETFEQLIQDGFWAKVHEFKESTGEMFFTPEIVAATIECNIRIGNKFVELVQLERQRTNPETVEQKYGYEYDQVISDAAGKTLHLVELLKSLPDPDLPEAEDFRPDPVATVRRSPVEKRSWSPGDMFKVNKWLLATAVVAVLASTGLYFWANQPSAQASLAGSARDIALENTPIKEYVRSGRATTETFYAITLPSWDQLSKEKQEEVLQQALVFANSNGQKYVQLVNVRGRNVAFASAARTEILKPSP
jgi:hypothetical protein